MGSFVVPRTQPGLRTQPLRTQKDTIGPDVIRPTITWLPMPVAGLAPLPHARVQSAVAAATKTTPLAPAQSFLERFGSSNEVTVLYEALEQISYPNIRAVCMEAKQLAKRLEVFLLPQGYGFQERGALYSPYPQYLSDVDLTFIAEEGMNGPEVISKNVSQTLLIAAQSVFEGGSPTWVTVESWNGKTYDGHYKEIFGGRVDELIQLDTEVINLHGIYSVVSAPGWRVPLDLMLTITDKYHPRKKRIKEILHNLQRGDFAKVVQQVRKILPPDCKPVWAAAVNHKVGRLRFVVKQLRLVERMNSTNGLEYVRTYLHLPVEDEAHIAGWREFSENAMQEEAYEVIRQFQELFLDVFPSKKKKAVRAYLQLWGESGLPQVPGVMRRLPQVSEKYKQLTTERSYFASMPAAEPETNAAVETVVRAEAAEPLAVKAKALPGNRDAATSDAEDSSFQQVEKPERKIRTVSSRYKREEALRDDRVPVTLYNLLPALCQRTQPYFIPDVMSLVFFILALMSFKKITRFCAISRQASRSFEACAQFQRPVQRLRGPLMHLM